MRFIKKTIEDTYITPFFLFQPLTRENSYSIFMSIELAFLLLIFIDLLVAFKFTSEGLLLSK